MRTDHRPATLTALCILVATTTGRAQIAPMGPSEPGVIENAAPAAQISNFIREILQDRDGDLWFGTNGDGVCRYDGTSLTYFSIDQGLSGTAVRSIVQGEGNTIWFATDGGVSRYEAGTFKNYTMADGLSDNSTWSMMRDTAGTLWVGTRSGLCRLDGDAFTPVPLPRINVGTDADASISQFTPKVVFGMHEDHDGDLWFGTYGEGAHRYDGTSFTSYTTSNGLAGNYIRSIQADSRGHVWIGTDGDGVSRYDGAEFKTYTTADGMSGNRVYEMLLDADDNMWFSTLGHGACRYDGEAFTSFGPDQGLTINHLPCPCGSGSPYEHCHGPNGTHVQEMLQDNDGIIWFGCSGGLFRLEGSTFINVTREGPWPLN